MSKLRKHHEPQAQKVEPWETGPVGVTGPTGPVGERGEPATFSGPAMVVTDTVTAPSTPADQLLRDVARDLLDAHHGGFADNPQYMAAKFAALAEALG